MRTFVHLRFHCEPSVYVKCTLSSLPQYFTLSLATISSFSSHSWSVVQRPGRIQCYFCEQHRDIAHVRSWLQQVFKFDRVEVFGQTYLFCHRVPFWVNACDACERCLTANFGPAYRSHTLSQLECCVRISAPIAVSTTAYFDWWSRELESLKDKVFQQ